MILQTDRNYKKRCGNKQTISDAEIREPEKLTTEIALIILSGLILIVFRSYNQKRKANKLYLNKKN